MTKKESLPLHRQSVTELAKRINLALRIRMFDDEDNPDQYWIAERNQELKKQGNWEGSAMQARLDWIEKVIAEFLLSSS